MNIQVDINSDAVTRLRHQFKVVKVIILHKTIAVCVRQKPQVDVP